MVRQRPCRRAFFAFLEIAFLLACFPFLCAADTGSRETAGFEESRFRRTFEKERRRASTKQESEAPLKDLPEEPAESAGMPAEFHVRGVRFMGNTSIPSAELQPIVTPIFGRTVTLHELEDITDEIKKYYRGKGYLSAYAYVPPQRIGPAGSVEIRIVEGRVGRLIFPETRWFSENTLRRMFRVKENAVLRYEDLRRDLARLNRHRDLKTKSVLKRGSETGTTDVEINVEEKFPLHLSLDMSNTGSESTGRYRYGLTAEHTNLLGLLDELQARLQLGEGTLSGLARYSLPLDAAGTKAVLSYSRSQVDVGGVFSALDIEGEAETYGASLTRPVIERRGLDAEISLGFDWKSAENRILGESAGRDELRVLKLGLDVQAQDDASRTASFHELDFGFSGLFGASDKVDERALRSGTGGQFFVYRGDLNHRRPLREEIDLELGGSLQMSPDRLPPSEQMQIGGMGSVRGYSEGEFACDSGGYGSAEILVLPWFIPADWSLPFFKTPVRQSVRITGFADVGYGSVRSPLNGEAKERFLAGAGGGLRIHLGERFFARLEWGAPLAGPGPADGSSMAFRFGVSVEVV